MTTVQWPTSTSTLCKPTAISCLYTSTNLSQLFDLTAVVDQFWGNYQITNGFTMVTSPWTCHQNVRNMQLRLAGQTRQTADCSAIVPKREGRRDVCQVCQLRQRMRPSPARGHLPHSPSVCFFSLSVCFDSCLTSAFRVSLIFIVICYNASRRRPIVASFLSL